VAQHVGVDGERQARPLADALHQSVDRVARERAAALGGEDEGRIRGMPARSSRSARTSVVAQRMGARLAPADMERGGAAEFDLALGPGRRSRSPAANCG
jgi:hypothetical protein